MAHIVESEIIRRNPHIPPRFIQDLVIAMIGQSHIYTRPRWIIHSDDFTHPSGFYQDLSMGSLSVYFLSQYTLFWNQ